MLRYRLLLSIALPLMLAHLLWGYMRGRQSRQGLVERLGGLPPGPSTPLPPDPRAPVWLHAASNGELASARPVIDWLVARGDRLLITTNSTTAQDLARRWIAAADLPPETCVALAPLDTRWVLRRFLRHYRPAALIVIENEIWPNRFAMMAQAGHPCLMLGARLSAGSARFWHRLSLGPLLAGLTAVSAQDAASQARFLALGLPASHLLPRINLKTAASPQVLPPLARWPEDWPRRHTWLAASTHEGEEELILEAFAKARMQRPELRLILAPRHPRRGAEIARMIRAKGFALARRSNQDQPSGPVYLADTLGEMGHWYRAAAACFTGGSFVPKGGHTPFEPLVYHCALFHGPHVENAREPYAALDHCGGARCLPTPEALAQAMVSSTQADFTRMTQAAQAGLPETDPAYLQDLLARLAPLLPPPDAKLHPDVIATSS
ncbi:glycosyltransferase N-terminal domain-containing protein [Thioclava litoralis]|uniref:3-deoxy-D-manno-octulosonic acid transferase n=1 Tax=Thioclava litoralis TaxID=3076557 RepID=A0ABZ1E044_9RHOB|nr:glycosyltransferase N-terminal domain-containing protein [Thioclava sp. FTW29]